MSHRHQKAKNVIESITGATLNGDVFEEISGGQLLGTLADSLARRNPAIQPNGGNLDRFYSACNAYGFDASVLVSPNDLQDRNRFEKVIDCILYLSTKLPPSSPRHPTPLDEALSQIDDSVKRLKEQELLRQELERTYQEEVRKRELAEKNYQQHLQEKEVLTKQLDTLQTEKQLAEQKLHQEIHARQQLQQQIDQYKQQLAEAASASQNVAVVSSREVEGSEAASQQRQQQLVLEEAERALNRQRQARDELQRRLDEVSRRKSELEDGKNNAERLKAQLDQRLAAEQAALNQLQQKTDDISRTRTELRQKIRDEERRATDFEAEIRDILRARERKIAGADTQQAAGSSTSSSGGGLKTDSYEMIPWDTLKIGKQIGTGAFAEVFEAFRAGERVAVKKFFAQSDDARKEMETEVSVMTQLHSGYVVSLYGACFTPPNMCIVMEFLPRGSLFYLLSDSSVELTWERKWSIARDTALGINYLHSKKPPLLHRDMKSGNLLLTADWRVKICDFGQTEEGNEKKPAVDEGPGGTARWTAPEVIAGETYTEAADVYSYGIILWELATRKIPFDDVPSYDLNKLVMGGTRPPEPDDCPREFKDLMKQCWSARPSQRPSFPDIVKTLQKLGKMKVTNITDDEANDPITKLENLLRTVDELKAKKESLERQWELTERKSEKEKDLRVDYERQKEEVDREIDREKRRCQELERTIDTLDRKASLEKQNKSEHEKKMKKELKKAEQKRKRLEEQLQTERDELQKKFEQEKSKNEKIKQQLDDAQSLLDSERYRRVDVEKQRDEAERRARAAPTRR